MEVVPRLELAWQHLKNDSVVFTDHITYDRRSGINSDIYRNILNAKLL